MLLFLNLVISIFAWFLVILDTFNGYSSNNFFVCLNIIKTIKIGKIFYRGFL